MRRRTRCVWPRRATRARWNASETACRRANSMRMAVLRGRLSSRARTPLRSAPREPARLSVRTNAVAVSRSATRTARFGSAGSTTTIHASTGQLARPESEHVVREYPELALVDAETWERVQKRTKQHQRGSGQTMRAGQRPYLVSGLLRCGVCRGPMSIASQKTKNGVRYANFGCTAYSSRGGSICSNSSTISEKKVTEALLEALRETLSASNVADAFAKAFGDGIERRATRDTDRKAVLTAAARFLKAIATEAPERGREASAQAMEPIVLTPKTEGPEHLIGVSGSVDLAKVFASGSSGGRI
jgi:Recombinase zinc beta ribbon domain